MTQKSKEIIEIIDKYLLDSNTSIKSKTHVAPNITSSMINNVFIGFKLPIIHDDIIAMFDDSLISNCKSGVIFLEEGFFLARLWQSSYYSNYVDIEKCELEKQIFKLTLSNNETLSVSFTKETSVFLLRVFEELSMWAKKNACVSNERETGEVKKVKDILTPDELKQCRKIIHRQSALCAGIGATPHIPLSDSIFITPLQIEMLMEIGNVFSVSLNKSAYKAILVGFSSSFVGRNISSLTIGWIPGIGNVVNLTTAASMTELIGWSFVRECSQNKELYIRKNIYDGIILFQDMVTRLNGEAYNRFYDDISFIAGKSLDLDKEKVIDLFIETISQYAVVHDIEVKCIFSKYVEDMKAILTQMKKNVMPNSQAYQYFCKFESFDVPEEHFDINNLIEFVELFLGFYNMFIFSEHQINRFRFDLERENPNTFFQLLYIRKEKDRNDAIDYLKKNGNLQNYSSKNAKNKIPAKELVNMKTLHAITSFLYCIELNNEKGEEND